MHTFSSTLHRADDDSWHRDVGYSPTVAAVLDQSYAHITRRPVVSGGFLRAGVLVLPHLKAHMSTRQRMHVYFVLATAFAADNQYTAALEATDRALLLALRLEEVGDQMELLSLRSSLNRAVLRFDEAISDLRDSIAILDVQRDTSGIDDVAVRLDLVSQLGSYAFFMSQYDVAGHALADARALAPLVPHGTFAAASIEWVQAHLYRVQGKPERALFHVLAFQEDYMREANPVSQDRLEFFIADTALDWADRLPPGTDRDAFVALARPHLQRAERLAKDNADQPGQGLARLARVHYSRLSGSGLDRIKSIDSVIQVAQTLHDEALLAQANTALGDELAARGELESALNCYRNALGVLDGSQVPVLALPAQRALRRAQGKDDWTPLT